MTLNKTKIASAVVLASTLVSAPTFAQELSEVEVTVGGFTRVDYSNGDRYSDRQGEDQLGISRAALAVTAKHENVTGVFVAGTEVLTNDNETTDGNIDIKDAYLVLEKVGGSPVTFSVGAQPLLYGLKPNGYPFDHSLQESIEYGAQGAFAVANQFGPSLIAYADAGDFNFRGGFFDLTPYVSEETDPEAEGASLVDSFFFQVKGENVGNTGLYGVLGYEQLFVTEENDAEQIYSIGLGWKNAAFDISVEYIELENAVVTRNDLISSFLETGIDAEATGDDENYIVIETSYKPTEDVNLYVDYAEASEVLEATTVRVGIDYWTSKHLKLTAEYAQDDLDNVADGEEDSVSSIDFRITLEY